MRFKLIALLMVTIMLVTANAFSQNDTLVGPPESIPAIDKKKWGPNDTIITGAIYYQNEWMPYKELEMAWVSNMSERKLAKYMEEWTRLRNAVYVTYPYARTAGYLMNDINAKMSDIKSKKERKAYLKTRENELKDQFADPLSNLSVYQGKILMKLINRQTGNNCYEIVKEYRGGVTARVYQTVAFFFGSSLKQEWDVNDKVDRQIENIVREIDATWYNNPYKPGIRTPGP
jgi:CRISPR/Cas system-associated protein endoribonuclease Cas2